MGNEERQYSKAEVKEILQKEIASERKKARD